MKIGKLPKKLKDYSKYKRINAYDIQIMILLGDVMWMGMDDIRENLVVSKATVVRSLKHLNGKHLVKIARREDPSRGLCRMYTLTQSGRNVINDFFNYLND